MIEGEKMTYAEQRQKVINIQNQIARINHQLENPVIRYVDSLELQDKRLVLLKEWDSEIKTMRAMPDHIGSLKH